MSYLLSSYKWGDPQYGRPGGTVTYGFDAAFYSSLSIAFGTFGDIEQAAAIALDTWSAVADINFVRASSAVDVDILFSAEFMSGSQIGEATTFFTNFGIVDQLTDAVVSFDTEESWSPFGEAGLNFFNVALHEIGHALGLGHPPNAPDQVMYAFYTSDTTLALGDGDIDGIQFVYGAARADVTGTLRNDVIDRSSSFEGLSISALAGDDIVRGTHGDDVISGGAGNDRIFGLSGNDDILDLQGDNVLDGGDDEDVLMGGIGANRLLGGTGNDLLLGGVGSDTLLGGSGSDVLVGDPAGMSFGGNDRLDGGPGSDRLMGGPGADVFVFADTGGNDTIAELDIDYRDPLASTLSGADFVPGLDRIELAPGMFADATELFGAIETVSGSAVITLGGTTMTIFGVTEAALSADDFIFA